MPGGDGGLVTTVSTDRNAPMNRITQPRTRSAQGWYPLTGGGYGSLVPISLGRGRGPGWGWLRESKPGYCPTARGPGWGCQRESGLGRSRTCRGPGWGWRRESEPGYCLSGRGQGRGCQRESGQGRSWTCRGRGWGCQRESGRGRSRTCRGPGWNWPRESDRGRCRSDRARTMTCGQERIHRALHWAWRWDGPMPLRQSESEGMRTGLWRESRPRTIL